MKCQFPDCNRQATVHLTELTGGTKKEIHLCEQHAGEMGVSSKGYFSAAELLAGIAKSAQGEQRELDAGAKCPTCGMTLGRFQASGRFGCPDCYTTFHDDIVPLVERIHDASQHVGKVPKRASKEVTLRTEVRRLLLELEETVKKEDYEKAARLRDEIKKLEDQLEAAKTSPKS
ncbi:MAG: UvrB/UvrC motif-containing protein [Planctomycetota bacterium]|nr:UvrB/UvrC motif-containing protein [Planctomycetota bacterium]